jgi:hypothetical protein
MRRTPDASLYLDLQGNILDSPGHQMFVTENLAFWKWYYRESIA